MWAIGGCGGQEGTSPGVTEGPGEVGCSRNRQPATTRDRTEVVAQEGGPGRRGCDRPTRRRCSAHTERRCRLRGMHGASRAREHRVTAALSV